MARRIGRANVDGTNGMTGKDDKDRTNYISKTTPNRTNKCPGSNSEFGPPTQVVGRQVIESSSRTRGEWHEKFRTANMLRSPSLAGLGDMGGRRGSQKLHLSSTPVNQLA
jgi:hypothetical protein